ncbi:hypothetical protein [Flavihumibacter sp. UBA7668]|uniref:hypothetical protein n=1 Tax=Flavihumibacter sp. UBA7668 TaxID=1946542 RepID=UPI0025BAE0FC|nr:hypothetical protein [Flavihumibacter sp. UBA7668]
MNPFYHLHLPFIHGKEHSPDNSDHTVVIKDESKHFISEGGEFLDDAIRMADLPTVYTEESVAPGNPDGFY